MVKELDFNNEIQKKKIQAFLKKNAFSEYNQSIEWNIVRNEKVKYYIYSESKEGKINWVCNLLDKSEGKDKCLYANRGPVLNYNSKETIKLFFDEIKEWMYNKGYFKIIINPCIDYDILQKFPKEISYEIRDKQDYNNIKDSCKLAIMDIIKDEQLLLSKLSNNIRRNTRKCYRNQLDCKISKIIDFNNFYKLYIETSKRHDFNPHDINYFKKIYEMFKDNLIFIEVWHENIPLAMSIDIIYNNKLIYLYGVSATNNRKLLGMYRLQWETIKYCIKNNIEQYDFGGVFCEENDTKNKDYGLYTFKKGYCYKGFIDIVPDIVIKFKKE